MTDRPHGRTRVATTADPAPRHDSPALRGLYGPGRLSAPRAAIAEVVLAMPGAFAAEDLRHALVATAPRIGLATVYRALGAMHRAGSITPVGDRNGSTLYARCDRSDHHHHLVCTSCGRVVGVECPLGHASLESASAAGHLVVRHEITLYGLCAECRTRQGDA